MLQAIGKKQIFSNIFSFSFNMAPIRTYVFLDLETTSLPPEDCNKSRITELSMVAVKRTHFLDTRVGAAPRIQNKLTLCFNPRRLVQPEGSRITGLCNDLLEYETEFNMQVFNLIDNFLKLLTSPVCLVAQNGIYFDYPILKNHFEKLNMSLSDDVMCADCYHAFYDILKNAKFVKPTTESVERNIQSSNEDSKSINEQSNKSSTVELTEEIPTTEATKIDKSAYEPLSKNLRSIDEIDFHASNISMQSINETTPKQSRNVNALKTPRKEDRISKARRRMPWGDSPKPKDSYKLKNIYERVLNRPAVDAHRAENDCILALEVSVALAEKFVEWVDNNHIPFSDINAMKLGVPLGQ